MGAASRANVLGSRQSLIASSAICVRVAVDRLFEHARSKFFFFFLRDLHIAWSRNTPMSTSYHCHNSNVPIPRLASAAHIG